MAAPFSIATFSADVTVPIGHGMMGGLWKAKSVADPLYAKGVVVLGGEKPIVLVSVDWCEIRNESFDRWREALAKAANTPRERVFLSAVHQHEAPITDLEAQRILERRKLKGSICALSFHDKAVQRVVSALVQSLNDSKRFTHLGWVKQRWRGSLPIVGIFYQMGRSPLVVVVPAAVMCWRPTHQREPLIRGCARLVFGMVNNR